MSLSSHPIRIDSKIDATMEATISKVMMILSCLVDFRFVSFFIVS